MQLSNVLSDLSGVSGMTIIGAILEGERDPSDSGRSGPAWEYKPASRTSPRAWKGTGARSCYSCSVNTWNCIESIRPRSPIATFSYANIWSRWDPKWISTPIPWGPSPKASGAAAANTARTSACATGNPIQYQAAEYLLEFATMGHSISLSATLWCAALVLAGPAAAQTVDEIIAKNIEARGGIEKLKAVKTIRMTAKINQNGFRATVVQENERPNKVREEFIIQGMAEVEAYDGKTALASLALRRPKRS